MSRLSLLEDDELTSLSWLRIGSLLTSVYGLVQAQLLTT